MIKRYYISLILVICLLQQAGHTQFINLQIKVESELSASVEQDLDFGELVINSGPSFIELGDINMGIYNIRAYYTQNVYVSLDYPSELKHTNPAILDGIPLDLSLAFNNTGTRNINESVILDDNSGYLPIFALADPTLNNTSEIWQEMYLYVYGSVIVGNINQGEYNAEILLLIEYD